MKTIFTEWGKIAFSAFIASIVTLAVPWVIKTGIWGTGTPLVLVETKSLEAALPDKVAEKFGEAISPHRPTLITSSYDGHFGVFTVDLTNQGNVSAPDVKILVNSPFVAFQCDDQHCRKTKKTYSDSEKFVPVGTLLPSQREKYVIYVDSRTIFDANLSVSVNGIKTYELGGDYQISESIFLMFIVLASVVILGIAGLALVVSSFIQLYAYFFDEKAYRHLMAKSDAEKILNAYKLFESGQIDQKSTEEQS